MTTIFPYIPFLPHVAYDAVVLANGCFPTHPIPLAILEKVGCIVCCDGAANGLLERGIKPFAIVGDLDSLHDKWRTHFTGQLVQVPDQTTNDLTKAVNFCCENKFSNICILGATGKREDHTLANLALLTDYAQRIKIQLFTDTGVFTPLLASAELESFAGQQVSVFSLTPTASVTSEGLRYPLHNLKLHSWWVGSLNEATGNSFKLWVEDGGKLLVYRKYMDD